ncbi:MAG: ERCC4 domain-containing protein [Candidatus Micrarchaeia archaeon]
MPEEKKSPRILADNREPESVCDSLEGLGAQIELSQLPLGDYLLSDRLAVERKTRTDFESSIIDGRLFHQLSDLSAAYARVVLIVEGEQLSESRLSRLALLGAYSSVISDFGCALFFTKSPQATAEMLHALAYHEQFSKLRTLCVYAKRRVRSESEQKRAIVESLPNVGPTLARALLSYFDTVENVMCAPESELCQVGKLGKKKAGEIRHVLASRYLENEDPGRRSCEKADGARESGQGDGAMQRENPGRGAKGGKTGQEGRT